MTNQRASRSASRSRKKTAIAQVAKKVAKGGAKNVPADNWKSPLGSIEKIIIVRHGDADTARDLLSEYGKREILSLVEDHNLRSFVVGVPTIFTSCADRAVASARIINEALSDCKMWVTDLLWSDNLHPGANAHAILHFIERHLEDEQTLIIMGHMPHGQRLARAFLSLWFNIGFTEPVPDSKSGEACMLDLRTKAISVINPKK